jgi:hypothetical protein
MLWVAKIIFPVDDRAIKSFVGSSAQRPHILPDTFESTPQQLTERWPKAK